MNSCFYFLHKSRVSNIWAISSQTESKNNPSKREWHLCLLQYKFLKKPSHSISALSSHKFPLESRLWIYFDLWHALSTNEKASVSISLIHWRWDSCFHLISSSAHFLIEPSCHITKCNFSSWDKASSSLLGTTFEFRIKENHLHLDQSNCIVIN